MVGIHKHSKFSPRNICRVLLWKMWSRGRGSGRGEVRGGDGQNPSSNDKGDGVRVAISMCTFFINLHFFLGFGFVFSLSLKKKNNNKKHLESLAGCLEGPFVQAKELSTLRLLGAGWDLLLPPSSGQRLAYTPPPRVSLSFSSYSGALEKKLSVPPTVFFQCSVFLIFNFFIGV